ncbi:reverse gyrase [Nitrosophilus alvini]|uniref:reverse gyrase n=1 Tax=Nitrosophilus alvini TaxID=2714855 RepID=UPI00190CE204|nr:reverse gyrase [Nitrosophilus alvini]
MIPLIYKGMCPNCGKDIDSDRLYKGLSCKNCLEIEVPQDQLCSVLKEGEFLKVCSLKKEVENFKEYFKKILGYDLREIQESWIKRFFLNISYALLAPTGVGKTTFGLILSSYLANKDKKSYIIFPTHLLANQAYEKLLTFGTKKDDVLFYDSKLSQKERELLKEKIKNSDFKILITTTMFLYKNFELLPKEFDFVFVDDVDSILKSAKNIDKILMLLGFSEEDIQKTLDFIVYKRALFSKGKVSQKELEEFYKKDEEIKKIASKKAANLIVSSATANPKSRRVLLFRELLGFEVSKPSIAIRNVEDVYKKSDNVLKDLIEYIKKFGKGGLVFLPSNETKDRLKETLSFLNSNSITAIGYEELDEENIEKFKKGEILVVVGIASYKNPLARGFDLPDTIRYAIFAGVPKLEFNLDITKHTNLYYFFLLLFPFFKKYLDEEKVIKISSYINYLKKVFYIKSEKLNENAKKRIEKILNFVNSLLNEDLIKKIDSSPDIFLKRNKNGFSVVTADVTGYIQASGRTSRLYVGGLTKGLSLILVDEEKAFNSLKKKVRWFSEEIEFKDIKEVDLEKIIEKVDKDRELVKKALKGELEGEKDLFKTTFMIVESPNKARTIASFYGKPIKRKIKNMEVFEIVTKNRILNIAASKGHVFDLNKEDGFHGVLKNSVFVAEYEVIDESRMDIIKALRELDLEVKEILIATDPDIEGEKIGFDIYLNSKIFNSNIKRAEFHEITKRAIEEAQERPRQIDEDLVKAQLVRRIADRWIGFEISQFLQKKFNRKTLSAGRVQSAVLEWIVKREDEVKEKDYIVRVKVEGFDIDFVFEDLHKQNEFFEKIDEIEIKYKKIEKSKLFKKPFSTDTMLFNASNELKFSPKFTMQLAQDLFEAGFITYHRTDSIRVSSAGINVAKEYIEQNFGKEFFSPRSFKTKEGAHECIRPTKPMDVDDLKEYLQINGQKTITQNHLKLYDLIFKEFIASQMRECEVEKVEAEAIFEDKRTDFSFIKKIVKDGFNKILPIETYKIDIGCMKIAEKEKFTKPKTPRFSFATLIQQMKEKGIGRPSTYAIIIQRLFERRYVYQKNGFIFATNLGKKVYGTLKSVPQIYEFVNERYTKELEELMDKIENKEADYQQILKDLYEKIKKEIHGNFV